MLLRFSKQQRLRRNGWVLVDALFGMVILSIALTAFGLLYRQVSIGNTSNRTYTNAVYIAQSVLEDIKQYDGTATIRALPVASLNHTETRDNVVYTVVVSAQTVTASGFDKDHIYPYKAVVSWTDNALMPSAQRSIQVSAYYYAN